MYGFLNICSYTFKPLQGIYYPNVDSVLPPKHSDDDIGRSGCCPAQTCPVGLACMFSGVGQEEVIEKQSQSEPPPATIEITEVVVEEDKLKNGNCILGSKHQINEAKNNCNQIYLQQVVPFLKITIDVYLTNDTVALYHFRYHLYHLINWATIF